MNQAAQKCDISRYQLYHNENMSLSQTILLHERRKQKRKRNTKIKHTCKVKTCTQDQFGKQGGGIFRTWNFIPTIQEHSNYEARAKAHHSHSIMA